MSRSQTKADKFLELLQPLQRALEVYCRRMLRDRSQVEDVLQSAVVTAFAQFCSGIEIRNFKAWIFRIVTMEIFNRNRKREPVVFAEVPADLSVEESWELVAQEDTFAAMLDDPEVILECFDDVVVGALEGLAPLERAAILLRSVGEFSYQEIHELLSIPLGSVMGYLSRARKRLRIALADYAAQLGLYRTGPPSGGSES